MIGSVRVSLGALRHNASALAEMVGPQAAAFVVKSNAYGHGLVETALAVEGFASRLCVYAVDEAIALRDGGVTKPILILGPVPPEELDRAHAAKVEISLWDTHGFLRRVQVAGGKRHRPFPVHVKINTGLNRLGLNPEDLADSVENSSAADNPRSEAGRQRAHCSGGARRHQPRRWPSDSGDSGPSQRLS